MNKKLIIIPTLAITTLSTILCLSLNTFKPTKAASTQNTITITNDEEEWQGSFRYEPWNNILTNYYTYKKTRTYDVINIQYQEFTYLEYTTNQYDTYYKSYNYSLLKIEKNENKDLQNLTLSISQKRELYKYENNTLINNPYGNTTGEKYETLENIVSTIFNTQNYNNRQQIESHFTNIANIGTELTPDISISIQSNLVSIANSQLTSISQEQERIYISWFTTSTFRTENIDTTYLNMQKSKVYTNQILIDYIEVQPPVIIYSEPIDVGNLMFTILTLPFSFISQAFNLTIFPGTKYQVNISNILLGLIAVIILITTIKIIVAFFKKGY